MGFAQLYYTSCERGLGGHAGYQFNAATPGVDARVLREVERFTAYEPPRSVPVEEVSAHPVSLSYAPDLAGARVVSRVVSNGPDPSGRPGNYFAHSLVWPGAGDTDAAVLPAELWGAGFWTQVPSPGPELPLLRSPSAPLDRVRTGLWQGSCGVRASEVARLLGAVDAAVDGGNPVLVVADSASVAHWVALVSHLLPPARARAVGFTTYCGRPGETFAHVVGVPPGTDTEGLRARFVVFRPPQHGWAGDGPRLPEITGAHRGLAHALVAAGPEQAPELWRRLARYGSGRERSLADWWPVLVASSVVEGPGRVTPEQWETARRWWAGASWLPRRTLAGALSRFLDGYGPDLPSGALEDLWTLAHRAGSASLAERLESEAALRSLRSVAAGEEVPEAVPLRSVRAREAARERIGTLLEGRAPGLHPDRVLALLAWARAARCGVPERSLERYGASAVAGLIQGLPEGAVPDPSVARLVRARAGVRRGLAGALSELPRERLARIAAGPVGVWTARDRDPAGVVLRELYRVSSPHPDPAGLVRELMDARRRARPYSPAGLPEHDLDTELLGRVLGPAGAPGPAEQTLVRLWRSDLLAPGVAGWIGDALTSVPWPERLRAWHRLAAALSGHWLRPSLPLEAVRVLEGWEGARPALRALARAPDGEFAQEGPWRVLRECSERAHPAVREVVRRRAAETLSARRDPDTLAGALGWCPAAVLDAYADRVGRALVGDGPDPALAASVFAAARSHAWPRDTGPRGAGDPGAGQTGAGGPGAAWSTVSEPGHAAGGAALVSRGSVPGAAADRAARLTDEVLSPVLSTWGRRRTNAVRRLLPAALAAEFDVWLRGVRGPGPLRRWWEGWDR
ncbi:GTPase-associated protein 1-related protein [Nocardiopsis kunsanensis]|uniref:GTPase-associated protein 1-related protein n=1 Tax=Nocardiopsis kunsanensis TaxID=141693 RepID=UPI00034954AB|nr:GTPase-associated protein 1-related protein [Nocardiopsis kunsanensis]